jgi:hypothetical protein
MAEMSGMSRSVFRRTKNPHWHEDMEALKELIYKVPSDLRIANYFSRKHVEASDVLEMIDASDSYVACMKTEEFEAYVERRSEVDKLKRQVADARQEGSTTFKAALIWLAIIWLVVLVCSELTQHLHFSDLKILFTLFSAGVALGSGAVVGLMIRLRKFDVIGALISVFLLALSVSSIALPIYFTVFHWQPIGAYADVVSAFCVGLLLSEETATGVSRLAKAVKQAVTCGIEWRLRVKSRQKWLGYSLEEVIYRKAVRAINDILGEDSTKLLVEQDSDGLRRLQDPRLTVHTKSAYRLQHLLNRMDSGSIAVTGPRGAGKSTLLRQMCTPQPDSSASPSIYISAPAEYVAREFLAELFQQICDTYLEKFDSPVASMKYRGQRTRRDTVRTVRKVATICRIIIRLIFALILLTIAFGPLFIGVHLSNTKINIPVQNWYNALAPHVDKFRDKYQVFIRLAAVGLAASFWPGKWKRKEWAGIFRQPDSIRRARNYSIHLKIERTSNWGAHFGLPGVRGASLSLSRGASQAYAPWSMPEMVGRLRDFVEEISRPKSQYVAPMIIGIDEIDRIGSVEQAERFIGEIKSIFGIPNCFFLVSVAEDVGFLFSRQSVIGMSTLEHSFDDVVVVDALNFNEARELLSARVPGFTDSFVFLALALSGGLPREIIRVARRLVDVNHEEEAKGYFPRIGDLALRLVAEDVAEVLRTSRSQLARMSLSDSWGEVFYRLRDAMVLLRSDATLTDERYKVIRDLSSLSSPNTDVQPMNQNEGEAAAIKILDGITAFASYSITVIEAFDNDYFDLHNARETVSDTSGGSYMELAAARMELGVSPDSSQAIVRRFRKESKLSKAP